MLEEDSTELRVKISTQLEALESDQSIHTEELKERIKIIGRNFKSLDIEDILDRFLYDPNQDEVLGFTSDNIEDWSENLEARI